MVGKQTKLGQHFLVNRNVVRKIVSAFLPAEGPILEIGPGRGILTEKIAGQSKNPLFAVELDPLLRDKLAADFGEKVTIIQADILKFNLEDLPLNSRVNIISNVPYYISRGFSFWLIDNHHLIRRCILMMQREFVGKLFARPGAGNYLPLSILFQTLFKGNILFHVMPGSFSPPPKVQSTVIECFPIPEFSLPVPAYKEFLFRSFHNRRKTLANNLADQFPSGTVKKVLNQMGLDPASRAETIEAVHFRKIWEKLSP